MITNWQIFSIGYREWILSAAHNISRALLRKADGSFSFNSEVRTLRSAFKSPPYGLPWGKFTFAPKSKYIGCNWKVRKQFGHEFHIQNNEGKISTSACVQKHLICVLYLKGYCEFRVSCLLIFQGKRNLSVFCSTKFWAFLCFISALYTWDTFR
jgi:hypothetical protein